MKRFLIPRKVDPDDVFVQGIEAAFLVALFLGLGYLLDRWFGTGPVFTILLVLIGGVGMFARMKYAYDARMARHEAERRAAPRKAA